MQKPVTIGLVVPFASDKVPDEGPIMYPDVKFVPRGVGVRSLTPAGYDAAVDGILPAARDLAAQGVDAIMVIGTSLTFYRGFDFHEQLLEKLRQTTGLPVSTMSAAVVEGLRAMGARRIAVATAYGDEVNNRLRDFLAASGLEVLALEGFGLLGFGDPGSKSEADIIELSASACAAAACAAAAHAAAGRPAGGGLPDGLLISCGGLRTLTVARPLEERFGIPVVSSTQAAFWSAMRLAGASSHVAGCGRLLEAVRKDPISLAS
jgi:arylmalonate decarboxylase